MISEDTKEMYAEVYSVLNFFGEEYINKLPSDLYKMIEDSKKDIQNKTISVEELENMTVKKDTIAMIALFHYKYWCESDEEREELKKIFEENQILKDEEVRKKYDLDNIFKQDSNKEENVVENKQSESSTEEKIEETIQEENTTDMIEPKESFWNNLISKIKSFFKKN